MYAELTTTALVKEASIRLKRQPLRNLIGLAVSSVGRVADITRRAQPEQLALLRAGQLDIRRGGKRYDVRSAGGRTDVIPRLRVVWPEWQREKLCTNLWLVPTTLVLGALGLFVLTLRLDQPPTAASSDPHRGSSAAPPTRHVSS